MKRSNFETHLGRFGLSLGVYSDACYYGACDGWSLALGPYPSDDIKQAKLAICTPSAKARTAIVDGFFAAADVPKDSGIDAALVGRECCAERGSKKITISWFDDELVVNVAE